MGAWVVGWLLGWFSGWLLPTHRLSLIAGSSVGLVTRILRAFSGGVAWGQTACGMLSKRIVFGMDEPLHRKKIMIQFKLEILDFSLNFLNMFLDKILKLMLEVECLYKISNI